MLPMRHARSSSAGSFHNQLQLVWHARNFALEHHDPGQMLKCACACLRALQPQAFHRPASPIQGVLPGMKQEAKWDWHARILRTFIRPNQTHIPCRMVLRLEAHQACVNTHKHASASFLEPGYSGTRLLRSMCSTSGVIFDRVWVGAAWSSSA